MGRIRVLFTIPNFDTTGSGKALLKIARGLNPEFFESIILCKHNRGEFFNDVLNSGIKIYLYDYETKMRPLLPALKRCYVVSRFFKRINPDIIYSFNYNADYSEPLAAKMAGIKWIYTKNNMSWGGASANAWKLRTRLASNVVLQNTEMQRFISNVNRKISNIHRGVEINEFKGSSDFTERKNVIVCVANIVPVKGVEILLRAFDYISEDYPNWSVFIVGDDKTNYAQELKNDFSQLIRKEKLVFTGKTQNVKFYLDQAQIFVLPTLSKGEGFPVALLEAMANGLIVIGSAVAGINDQLKGFEEKHLFESGNAIKLSSLLRFWISQSISERQNASKYLFAHVKVNFPLKKEIELHEILFRKIYFT